MLRRKTSFIIPVIISLLLFGFTNVYADIVFPAIANQFAVSFVVGFYWSILIALSVLIIEAVFIKKLLSLGIVSAFVISFIVNSISSVAGVLITSLSVHGKNIFAYGNMKFGTYLGLLPGYVLTVLIEGLLFVFLALLLKREKKASDCFKTSALMNFCSYLILLAGIIIADIATKGNNFNIR